MLAVAAAILLAVAFVLHVVGHAGKLVTDFELAGLVFVALALAFGGWAPWVRPRP